MNSGPPATVLTPSSLHRATTSLTDDTWHHVAVTWEPGADNLLSHAKFYVDGVEETISSIADTTISTGPAENVNIGCFLGSNCFQGLIDDVRIYDRTLSETEIQEIAGQ